MFLNFLGNLDLFLVRKDKIEVKNKEFFFLKYKIKNKFSQGFMVS